jgi:hypothetical protein
MKRDYTKKGKGEVSIDVLVLYTHLVGKSSAAAFPGNILFFWNLISFLKYFCLLRIHFCLHTDTLCSIFCYTVLLFVLVCLLFPVFRCIFVVAYKLGTAFFSSYSYLFYGIVFLFFILTSQN